jgi:ATP-dependent protease HslVU (ClpYQ) peptidase subunit
MSNEKPQDLSAKIKSTGEAVDKTLESLQETAKKWGKRIVGLIGAIAIGLTVFSEAIKSFNEKTKNIFQGANVEKVKEDKNTKTYRVKGGGTEPTDLKDEEEPQSGPRF